MTLSPTVSGAQTATNDSSRSMDGDIVVTGRRLPGEIDTDIAPVARLNADAIRHLGVSTVAELVKALGSAARSADGSDPISVLDGRMPTGRDDIYTLPPEAFAEIEIFPEPLAVRFGYPPRRRVMNFVTKRRFRAVEVNHKVGTTTEGGAASTEEVLGVTRIRDQRRVTLNGTYSKRGSLLQEARRIAPNMDDPYDSIGNVSTSAGGEIDPGLSALAGFPVTSASVPRAAAARSTLAAYATGANRPARTDVGPWRTLLPVEESWKLATVMALPLKKSISASFSLSAERRREWSLQGPAPVRLVVPSGSLFSPFQDDVILNRYLTEVPPLRQSGTTTTVHGGGAAAGYLSGWNWNVMAAVDRQRSHAVSEGGIEAGGIVSGIAGGGNPFGGFPAAALSSRILNRSNALVTTADMKAVASGTPIDLPAGQSTLTISLAGQRSATDTRAHDGDRVDRVALDRTQFGGSVALSMPVASRSKEVLGDLGDLAIDARIGMTGVTGLGSLRDVGSGMSWTPFPPVQITLSLAHTETAPTPSTIAVPTIVTPNVPFFDSLTGQSVLVATVSGGNPALPAEKRRTASVSLSARPLPDKELRLRLGYTMTAVRDQVGTLSAVSREIQQAFPGVFVRDQTGRVVSVDVRPVRFAKENIAEMTAGIEYNGELGKTPPSEPAGEDAGMTVPAERPTIFLSLDASIRARDRLLLREGLPRLDLLQGDTTDGAGPTPQTQLFGYANLYYKGASLNISSSWRSPARIRSPDASSDLRFSSLFKANLATSLMLDSYFPEAGWASKAKISLTINNVLNARTTVRDRMNRTPDRYQPAYLDPLGRTVGINFRKLF